MAQMYSLIVPLLMAGASENLPKVDFDKQIAPILARSCHECHGPGKTEAGLRLDRRTTLLAGGESGTPGLLPGNSGESLIVQRITSSDDDLVMPPKGNRLSKDEIDLIKQWIDEGATGPDDALSHATHKDHWAFRKPVRPSLPTLQDTQWPSNPLDVFVRAKQEEKSLTPARLVERAKWLRRASLDLIGLLPTLSELDSFLDANEPDAHDREVDRLLASAHFGERWGRLWLDAARYADSNGYEKDRRRNAWVYRDWVVSAFNEDMPYDRFILEQIAGDLLPGATQDQIVATGFLRNSMVNEEGAIDPEQFRMEAMFDRMDAVGKAVLGLTIQCTQCHNHKFDPMTQEEYYRLFAFLNNAHEARPATYTPADRAKMADLRRQIAAVEENIRSRIADVSSRLATWESEILSSQKTWHVLKGEECLDPGGGVKYERLADESWLGAGYAPSNVTTRFKAATTLSKVTGLRLEVLMHPNLPADGPGRSDDGTWALTEIVVTAEPLDGSSAAVGIKLVAPSADAAVAEGTLPPENTLRVGPVAFSCDGKNETAWSAANGPARQHVDRTAHFAFEKPVEFPSGTRFVIHLGQAHGKVDPEHDLNREIGRFRLLVTDQENPSAGPVIPKQVIEAAQTPAVDRSPEQEAALFAHWRTGLSEFKEENERIERLLDSWPTPTAVLAYQEREVPRVTAVLKRGDWLKPTKEVVPGVPAFLHPLPTEPTPLEADRPRLLFGRWLGDPESPTTNRVIVNRLWQAYFGLGLVATPEDLGTQSEPPSHPELLDWLAVELLEGGNRLKEVHRLIVTSTTYRQSSEITEQAFAADPTNRWLARGPRFRVDAELVRDVALSAGGLLHSVIGGPAVFPPAPEFLFVPPASYERFTWREATDGNRYRRSIYTYRRRSTPYPALAAFDAPTGEASCVRRQRSNTPVQALVTLNEPVFLEAAQALALDTTQSAASNPIDRAARMFRKVTSRTPTEEELGILLGLFEQQNKRFAEGWIDPKQVAYADPTRPAPLAEGVTPTELGAWTVVARAILNLDEAIIKE